MSKQQIQRLQPSQFLGVPQKSQANEPQHVGRGPGADQTDSVVAASAAISTLGVSLVDSVRPCSPGVLDLSYAYSSSLTLLLQGFLNSDWMDPVEISNLDAVSLHLPSPAGERSFFDVVGLGTDLGVQQNDIRN